VTQAVEQHPTLRISDDRIRISEGLRKQAGLVPNPRLVLQTENTRPYSPFVFLRDTDNFAYLQQTFETGGKRDRRLEAATTAITRQQLERALTERQVTTRVRLAYWQAAGAALIAQLLAEDRERFQQIITYHEARVREGAMAEVDLIRVRLEGERLAVALNSARLDAERFRIALQREMGLARFDPIELASPLEPLPPPSIASVEEAIDTRPELRLARHLIEQARANLRLQQSGAKPNVDVLFGYKRTSGFDTMIGGVQFDLPFANRNQGNIEAATAEITLAESSRTAAEAIVRAEVESALREVEIRRRQLTDQLPAVRRQADETARIAEAAYREGGTDLLRLLDAQRLRLETQLLYSRSLTEYRQSLVALDAALGVTP
jgi:outer membrane protein TolC